MSDDLTQIAKYALREWQGKVDAGKLAVFAQCMGRIEELEKISTLLRDDRYESKDWKQASLSGRIEWLIAMLEAKREEVDMWVKINGEQL